MTFTCDHCQRHYSISDEKVRGRRVRVKCKACGAIVTVGPLEEEAAPPPEEERTRMVAVDDLERLRARAARPAKEPAEAAKQNPFDDEPTRAVPAEEAGALWFAMIKGVQEGPYDTSALRGRIFAGEIGPKTYLWKNGMADWKRAAEVPELAGLMKAAPQSRPPAKKAVVKPPPDAPGISVTASQILDTSEIQRAVESTNRRHAAPPPTRKSTAELNAGELFSDLGLSKIVKNPLLQQPLEIENESEAAAAGLGSPPEGSLLDSEVRSAERPGASDEDRRGNGLRRGLAAALVLVVLGLGLFGAARAGLLPARVLAMAGLGGTTGPAKAAPPAKPDLAAQPPQESAPPAEPGTGKPAPKAAP